MMYAIVNERRQPAQHLPPQRRLIFLQLEKPLDQRIPLHPKWSRHSKVLSPLCQPLSLESAPQLLLIHLANILCSGRRLRRAPLHFVAATFRRPSFAFFWSAMALPLLLRINPATKHSSHCPKPKIVILSASDKDARRTSAQTVLKFLNARNLPFRHQLHHRLSALTSSPHSLFIQGLT